MEQDIDITTATESEAAPPSDSGAKSENTSFNDQIDKIIRASLDGGKADPKAKDIVKKPYLSDADEEEVEPEEKAPVEKPERKVKEKVEVEAKDEEAKVIKAPRSWTKEEKAEFEKLSEPAKKAILRSEGEKESLIGQRTRELETVTKQTKEAVDAHEYVKQVAEKSGAPTPRHFIERMVAAQEQSVKDPVGFIARLTDQNPMGYVRALMQRYNIDVRQLAAGRDDLAFDDQTHQQQTEMQRVQRENAEMKAYFESQRQQQEQSQAQQQQEQYNHALSSIESELNQFYNDKSPEERDAATPYIEHAVRVVMAEANQKGEQISSYSELIRRAHAKALRLNDNYNPVQGQNADYARSRAVSPTSRSGMASHGPKVDRSGKFQDNLDSIIRFHVDKMYS